MNNIKTISSILLLLSLLTGCWGITFKSDTPTKYIERKNTIESFYGSTQEDIIRELGEPEQIENRGGSTYFIYQWKRSDIGVVFMILPIPVGGGRVNANLYCLFLEFDEANHLIKHISGSRFDHDVDPWMELDCIDIFSGATWYLTQEISNYCPYEDLGPAQKHICDLFYLGAHETERDLIRAYVWCSLAANGGDKVAAKQLDELTNEISLQQLNEAQIKLEEWKPGQCEKDLFALFHIESLPAYIESSPPYKHSNIRTLRLQNAAVKGDAEKQLTLYWESSTGPDNTKWLCRAADQGNTVAQSRLGLLYSYGSEGLPKDMAKALMWYRLSASNGSQDASSEITKIQQTLTADQYTRSQELYQDWKPGLCELDIIPDNTGR